MVSRWNKKNINGDKRRLLQRDKKYLMLPAHYALSEILIVLVSVYTLTVFFKARQFYIFAGVFLISCAALIASIRFGINYQNELKSFHQLLSAISLLFGIPLIVIEIMKRSNLFNNKIIYLYKYNNVWCVVKKSTF